MKKAYGLILVAMIAIMTLTGCGVTRIGPGHVGIQVELAGKNRGVSDYATTTGWVFYNPLSTQIVEYPTYVQTYVWTKSNQEGDESFTFPTKDGMRMNIDVNLSYQLAQGKIPAFYVKFRNDDITAFTFGYLHNVTRDCFTQVGPNYMVEDIMGPKLDELINNVRDCVTKNTADIGVEIQNFGVVGFPRPPEAVIETINAKVQATQLALQKQNEVAQAQAEAQKQVAIAEGQAKSQIATAQGEAEANRVRQQSITPQLLEWRKLELQEKAIDKWKGDVPAVNGGGAGMLFNLPLPQGKQ